jgi:hypothetical protein
MKANAFLEIIALMRAAKCDTIKILNEPFMPLCVEFIGNYGPSGTGNECVSFCHYGEQNGDAMRDPEVIFEIVPKDGENYLFAYNYRNDYAGFESDVFANDTLDRALANEINAFALLWAENLTEQGFVTATRDQLAAPAIATETATASAASSNG